MSICYYLAGKKNRRLFDIGDHKCSLYLWRHLNEAITSESRRPIFVTTVVDWMRQRLQEHPDWYTGESIPELIVWAEVCAKAVLVFCEEEDWNVAVVNDCDDSLLEEARRHRPWWPVTHSIYVNDNEGDTTCTVVEHRRRK